MARDELDGPVCTPLTSSLGSVKLGSMQLLSKNCLVRHGYRSPRAVVSCAALFVLFGQVVFAQECPPEDRVKAVALVKQGLARMDAREYDLAAEDFRSAYALCPEAMIRKYLGRACEAAGRLEEAAVAYEACLREADTDALRRECESSLRAVRERMKEGVLVVEADPGDALVYLDGAPVGHEAGRAIPVRSGPHSIEVRAKGYLPFTSVVEVKGGDRPTRVQVRLEPERSVEPPPLDTTWNWVGVGVGAAMAVTGVVFLGVDIKDRLDAADCPAGYTCRVKPTNAAVGGSLMAVGVAAILTSALLWPEAEARAALGPAPGGGWVALEFGF